LHTDFTTSVVAAFPFMATSCLASKSRFFSWCEFTEEQNAELLQWRT